MDLPPILMMAKYRYFQKTLIGWLTLCGLTEMFPRDKKEINQELDHLIGSHEQPHDSLEGMKKSL